MSSCSPQASGSISPSGFRVREVKRKQTSPQIAIKKHRVKFWTTGIMMSTGQDFTPKPYFSSLSFCITDTGCLLTVGFLFPQENCPSSRGWPDPNSHLHVHSENDSLCLLQMLLCLCCWGISLTSPFIPGSSQTSTIFNNFCGHVNITESMEDLKPIWSKAQMLMAWIHTEWTGKGKVVKTWKVLFWRLHSSETDI